MVSIVADSANDIPANVVKRLGITVVPVNLSVGEDGEITTKTYKDGEMSHDEIFRLQAEGRRLTTSAPSVGDFVKAFEGLLPNEIIVFTITAFKSATHDAAVKAKEVVESKYPNCKVEVIDSKSLAMGSGLIAINAAEMAAEKKSFEKILRETKLLIPKIHIIGMLETLEYAVKGGRLAAGILSKSPIKIMPVLTMKDGDVRSSIKIRPGKKGVERKSIEFVSSFDSIEAFAVEYAAGSEKSYAEALVQKIREIFPEANHYLSQISPVLGVHSGPGVVLIAVLTA